MQNPHSILAGGQALQTETELKTETNLSTPIGPIGFKRNFVDDLLDEYATLIVPAYKRWFGKAFTRLLAQGRDDIIYRCAAEARADGREGGKRLFALLIKREAYH